MKWEILCTVTQNIFPYLFYNS